MDIKHFKKMFINQKTSCIWVYLWLLDKMTSIDKDTRLGKILYGKPIKWEEIAPQYGHDIKTIRKIMRKLEKEGYITLKRTPYGHVISLTKAKKLYGVKMSQDLPGEGSSEVLVEIPHEGRSLVPKSKQSGRSLVQKEQQSGRSNNNKILTNKINTLSSPKVDEDPSSKKKNLLIELLEWSVERRGGKFANVPKQMRALGTFKKLEISPQRVKNRWVEMERDSFWKEKGFDWQNVLNSFDKKP